VTETEWRKAYLDGALNEAEWWSRRLNEIVAEERARVWREAGKVAERQRDTWRSLNDLRHTERRDARACEAEALAEIFAGRAEAATPVSTTTEAA